MEIVEIEAQAKSCKKTEALIFRNCFSHESQPLLFECGMISTCLSLRLGSPSCISVIRNVYGRAWASKRGMGNPIF